jgi:hypothetical protein
MDHYYSINERLHANFVRILTAKVSKEDIAEFERTTLPFHNRQWSEHVFNIMDIGSPCPNDCRYCYMKTLRARFFSTQEMRAIEDAPKVHKRASKKWRSNASKKLFMFPSSHDIVPAILGDYIKSARCMLAAGHSLMLVSKPRMDCIAPIAEALDAYKARVIYRLTITSDKQEILNYWEPRAPPYTERLDVLKMLHARGCITSVSMEPFLSDPLPVITAISPYVTETIWIGTMSGLKKGATDAESARLAALYDVHALRELAIALSARNIRWKAKTMVNIARTFNE